MNGRSGLNELRHRVELWRKEQVADASGGLVETFVSLGTVWAHVGIASVRPAIDAGARAVEATLTVKIRFRSDLSPGDRMIAGSHTLEILFAQDADGKGAYLNCLCRQTNVAG